MIFLYLYKMGCLGSNGMLNEAKNIDNAAKKNSPKKNELSVIKKITDNNLVTNNNTIKEKNVTKENEKKC